MNDTVLIDLKLLWQFKINKAISRTISRGYSTCKQYGLHDLDTYKEHVDFSLYQSGGSL